MSYRVITNPKQQICNKKSCIKYLNFLIVRKISVRQYSVCWFSNVDFDYFPWSFLMMKIKSGMFVKLYFQFPS